MCLCAKSLLEQQPYNPYIRFSFYKQNLVGEKEKGVYFRSVCIKDFLFLLIRNCRNVKG